MKQRLFLWWD